MNATITYDAQGGSVSPASGTTNDVGELTSLPTPTRAGYTFTGWYTAASGGTQVTTSRKYTNHTTIYARWSANSYYVAYNKNNANATGSMSNSSHTYGTASNLTANAYSLTGHTFGTWSTNTGGGGTTLSNSASVSTLVPASNGATINLYAQWSANTYSVVYNKNNANATGSMSNSSHTYNVAKNLTANAYSLTGHTFAGWATSANGSVAYANSASVNNLTTANGGSFTLYAVWQVNTYTIAYNANGGSGSMGSTSCNYGTSYTLSANAFTRTGYTFLGWSTSSTATSATYSNQQSVSNLTTTNGGTVNLYAVWQINTYTIVYNANGGSGSMSNTSCNYGTTYALAANAFTRTGYTFLGWSTSSSATSATYTDQQNVSNLSSTNGATVNLYAVWQIITYAVTYQPGTYGSGSNPPGATKTYGVTLNLPSGATYTRTGYTQTGWTTDVNGGGTNLGYTYTTNAAATLYPYWTVNTYTVEYNKNAGDAIGSTASSSHTYGVPRTLTQNGYTRIGYSFAGWATSAGGSVAYSDGQTVSNLTDAANALVILYAVWSQVQHLVTFDPMGGTQVPLQAVQHGAKATSPFPEPFLLGYELEGWYKEDTFKTKWNFSVDLVTMPLTLYAKWLPRQYTVTFNAHGGTPAPPQQQIGAGDTVPLPQNPTREGYTFGGWYTGTDYATPWNFNVNTVTGSITLHAKWTIRIYTVTFDAQGGNPPASTVQAEHGTAVNAPLEPTMQSFEFVGWMVSLDPRVAWNFSTDLVTSDTTLYAFWAPDGSPPVYTVTFDPRGGTLRTPALHYINVGGTVEVPELSPVNYSYTFTGWYSDFGCTQLYDFNTPITANITLYAGWTGCDGGFIAAGNIGGLGWSLCQDGSLLIHGSGAMPNYNSIDRAPWYAHRALITSLVVGQGVTNLSAYALYGCVNLAAVSLPQSMQIIGARAFQGCTALAAIDLPDGIETIGIYTFSGCTSLAAVTLPYALTEVSAHLFDGCTSLAAVVIGENVTIVDEFMFADCSSLLSITSLNREPPEAQNDAFTGVPQACCIFIPEGSEQAYAEAWQWERFGCQFIVRIVTFDPCGGTPTPRRAIVLYGNPASPPSPAPTLACHTFEGWYTSTDYTTPWDFNTSITSDTVLYAKWELVQATGYCVQNKPFTIKIPLRALPQGIVATFRWYRNDEPAPIAQGTLSPGDNLITCTIPAHEAHGVHTFYFEYRLNDGSPSWTTSPKYTICFVPGPG